MTEPKTPRVPPLERSAWPDGYDELLEGTVANRESMEEGAPFDGKPLGILAVLANHSTIIGPFITWATAVALGKLSRRHHELLALRAIWILRSEFEYGHHMAYARGAGLSEAEIDGVKVGPSWPGWTDLERALVSSADELLADHVISDGTWATLAESLDVEQLIEVPISVGQYTMLSFVADSLEVQLEDGYDRLPPLDPAV